MSLQLTAKQITTMSSKPIIVPSTRPPVRITRPSRVLIYIHVPVNAEGAPLYDTPLNYDGSMKAAVSVPILLTKNQATVLNFTVPKYSQKYLWEV